MAEYRGNVVSSILNFGQDDENPTLNFHDILTAVDNHQLLGYQKTASHQETISHIHRCLNTSTNRHEGLVLLERLVTQCSTEIFTTNSLTWFSLLTLTLQSHGETTEKQLSCQILKQVLATASKFPELAREISSTILPKLLPVLIGAPSSWEDSAVSCISSCIKNFPGPCKTFRGKLESHLRRLVDKQLPSQPIIDCFANLAQLGTLPNQSGKHTDGWTHQCTTLLSSLHHILAQLYEGVETDGRLVSDNGLFTFPQSEPTRSSVLTANFKTAVKCLQALLSGEFPCSVRVPGQQILNLVCRCLGVSYKMLLSRPTTDRIRLFSLLPELHCSGLSLLHSLITSCQKELLPLSEVMNHMFLQMLVYTHMDAVYGQERPLSNVRHATYDAMKQWLMVAGTTSNLATEEKDLVKEILHDVTLVTDTLKLGGSDKATSDAPPSKKRKKGSYHELSEGMTSYRKLDHHANAKVTNEALQVLYLILSGFGDVLKQKIYQDILDSITNTVLQVQQTIREAPPPYSDPSCRQSLYRVLLSCCLLVHPRVASPLQIYAGVLRRGLQDPDVQVSYVCREALLVCESLIHPRAPCLRGPKLIPSTITVSHSVLEDLNANTVKETGTNIHSDSSVNSRTHVHILSNSDISSSGSLAIDRISGSGKNVRETSSSGASRLDNDGHGLSSNDIASNETVEESEESSDENMDDETVSSENELHEVEPEKEELAPKSNSITVPSTYDNNKASSGLKTREIKKDVSSVQNIGAGDQKTDTKPGNIDAMLCSFVDAEPDSD